METHQSDSGWQGSWDYVTALAFFSLEEEDINISKSFVLSVDPIYCKF